MAPIESFNHNKLRRKDYADKYTVVKLSTDPAAMGKTKIAPLAILNNIDEKDEEL